MNNITSIPRQVDEGSEGVRSFLAPKRSDKLKIFESLKDDLESAIEQPDTRRSGPRAVPDAAQARSGVGEGVGATVEVQHQLPEPPLGKAAEPTQELQPASVAKPSSHKMVEKTFSIDKDQYRLLVRYSNMEGLRLESNIPVSEIVRRLFDFALAHVDPAKGNVFELEVPGRVSK